MTACLSLPPRRRRIALLRAGCAVLALSAAAPLRAQEDDAAPYRLSPIIVDARGAADDDAASVVAQELWVGGKVATSVLDTPASVSVITRKEIEARAAVTTEEVLQYSPGILTDYYGTDDRNDYFLIRGFQATTYRDGLTLGSMRGVREEPLAYDRVEVLRGANSTLFGAADPGGSVNFVTKTPRFERFAETALTYGSFDRGAATLDMGDVLDAGRTLAWRFTAKVQDGGLEYDHSRDDETFLMGGLSWEPTADTSFDLVFDYLKRDGTPNSGGYPLDRDYDRGDFFGEPDFNYHDVERRSVTAMAEHRFGGGLSLKGNLRYSRLTDDFGYVYLYDYAGRTGDSLQRYYFGTDSRAEEVIGNVLLQYDGQFGTVDTSTVAGLEFREASTGSASIYGSAASIDLSNPVYSGGPADPYVYGTTDSDYRTRSAFLQQNISFDDRFIATFGLRHDWMDLSSAGQTYGVAFDDSDDFSETTMRGALTWKVTPEVSSYLSYVESVAPPTIGVAPERGQQYEVGVKYAPSGLNAIFSASLYDLTKKDVTIAVVQDNGTIERETLGESRVRGLDLEAKADLTDRFTLIAAYSRMDSEVVEGTLRSGTSIKGNAFATAPEQVASLWGTYTLPGTGNRGDMTFGLGLRHVGSYYFDAANTAKSSAATLVDASYSYAFAKGTEVALNVSNLFDEQHVVGSGTADYYNPGRALSLTLRKSW